MIGTVVLVIAVFTGAYYASKFVGTRYQSRSDFSKNLSILETCNVGKDRTLLLVKAANKAFIIGSTSKQFTLISELSLDELAENTDNTPERMDFSSILRTALRVKDKKHREGENK